MAARSEFVAECGRRFDKLFEKAQEALAMQQKLSKDIKIVSDVVEQSSVNTEEVVQGETYSNQENGEAASKPESKIEEKTESHSKEPVEIYLKVLINFRDKAEDKYKKNESKENEYVFKCLFEVAKEVILTRRKRLRGMPAPIPFNIIEWHKNYILRKRDEFLKSPERRFRGLFQRSCELIKMLTEVSNLCEQEMELRIK